jgi:putative PIN family toxin of toxin-antitoxin system
LRFVFDTNVYVSAFAIPGSKAGLAFALASRGVFDLVVSPEILAELLGKLADPKFGFSRAELEDAERRIRNFAVVVEPELRLSIVTDEPDNRILECAIAAGASAVVTGDRHLLALKNYRGIDIMTVSDLLYTFPSIP